VAHSGDDRCRPVRPLIGVLRTPPQGAPGDVDYADLRPALAKPYDSSTSGGAQHPLRPGGGPRWSVQTPSSQKSLTAITHFSSGMGFDFSVQSGSLELRGRGCSSGAPLRPAAARTAINSTRLGKKSDFRRSIWAVLSEGADRAGGKCQDRHKTSPARCRQSLRCRSTHRRRPTAVVPVDHGGNEVDRTPRFASTCRRAIAATPIGRRPVRNRQSEAPRSRIGSIAPSCAKRADARAADCPIGAQSGWQAQ